MASPGLPQYIVSVPQSPPASPAAPPAPPPLPPQFLPAAPAAPVNLGPFRPPAKSADRTSGLVTALLVILVIVLIGAVLLCAFQAKSHGLAKSLHDVGWKVYVTPNCSACKRQLELIQGIEKKQMVVSCGQGGPAQCKNIPAFPYWVNHVTGETRTGMQCRGELMDMVCSSMSHSGS